MREIENEQEDRGESLVPMTEEELLTLCEAEKDAAVGYMTSELDPHRENALRDYMQEPNGSEEEGHSTFVSSEVFEAIEWVKPGLLKIFTGSDNVVEFEPTHEEDVDSAQQATDGCNYVFYKQNNGFMVLHTAISDMLMFRNCAVMWRNENKKRSEYKTFQGVTGDELTLIMQQLDQQYEKVETVNQSVNQVPGPEGLIELHDLRVRCTSTVKKIKIDAFSPEDLLVSATHTSPLLEDCPYVARRMRVTLSDVRQMGFDVDADDMTVDRNATPVQWRIDRSNSPFNRPETSQTDPSQTEGDLFYEFMEVDFDGDGIAERRLVIRLPGKILSNEPVDMVQICTSSPILRSHRWDGLSMADMVTSLQGLGTELMRQMLDSLYLANNPRMTVLTQRNGPTEANIDDLLDSRPGGVVRQYQNDAVQPLITPWVGQQTFPMLEHLSVMGQRKTGITSYNQGMDANSLNKTATGITQILSQANQRMELMARIIAETLVKPIMKGILKLLTEGGMEPLAFKLNGKFVQLDPNEWRDEYNMTVNVGLGTGNKDQMLGHLTQIAGAQAAAVQGGMLGKLVTPKQLYHTQAKIVENAGFKDVGSFWTNPEDLPPEDPSQKPPDPEMMKVQQQGQLEQAKMQQADSHVQIKTQADAQAAQLKLQSAIEIERIKQDAETQREAMRLQAQREGVAVGSTVNLNQTGMEGFAAQHGEQTQVLAALLASMQESQAVIAQAMQQNTALMAQVVQNGATARKTKLIRDASGRAIEAVSVPLQGAE